MVVYPNPSSDIIYVKIEELQANTALKIYNVMGTEVGSKAITEELSEISVSNLETGIYMIEIIQGNNRSVERIVVQ
jgi:hypothetical protein